MERACAPFMEIHRIAVRREDRRHPERVALAHDDLVGHLHRDEVEPGDPTISRAEGDERAPIGKHPERQPAGGIRTADDEAVARQRVARRALFESERRAVEGEFRDGRAHDIYVLRLLAEDDGNAKRR